MPQNVPKKIMYKTKFIQFLGRTTPIILQNENGPCPLLAICNVLFLRNNLTLNPGCDEVSEERLLSLVVKRLLESNSQVNNKDKGYIQNQQQNIADAIDVLPRFATGIDVDIRFRKIDDFVFTSVCTVFDLLDIPLYHGWIVDPQDVATANAIGSKSYNALTTELTSLDRTARGRIIRKFMTNGKSQLTICGLIQLHEDLKERKLCVFFRNNHFSTMFKFEGGLYLLATDQGYLNQPDLVWENLNEVNGNTTLMTATFKEFKVDSGTSGSSGTCHERNTATHAADYLASINKEFDTGMKVKSDLELAKALQQVEFEEPSPRRIPTQQPTSVGASPSVICPQEYHASINNVLNRGKQVKTDEELAKALQQEEYEEQSRHRNPAP